ncbi:MAG: twin-arginine translocation signal domain-containing protein [Chitinivibrionales bacterium]|nr:twin-arginine translocation signal domain-containing protein [Chitinivibrionales bacterium]
MSSTNSRRAFLKTAGAAALSLSPSISRSASGRRQEIYRVPFF